MKEYPILFNTEMVRAILAGRKTQTRRPLKHQPPDGRDWTIAQCMCTTVDCSRIGKLHWVIIDGNDIKLGDDRYWKQGYEIGDRLWVREKWRLFDSRRDCSHEDLCSCAQYNGTPIFWTDYESDEDKWRPSIHMPRQFARIILGVTGSSVERVQDITEEEAVAEGFEGTGRNSLVSADEIETARDAFSRTWQDIYGEQSWQRNDWVVNTCFKVVNNV